MIDPALVEAVARIARVPALLVGADFDGTLSYLVDLPSEARPVAGAIETLAALAELPRTTVVLVSGRRRSELAAVSGAPSRVLLVGSHGTEWDDGAEAHPRVEHLYERVVEALKGLELRIERKPATVTVHTRGRPNREAEHVERVLRELAEGLGVRLQSGKSVVELHVSADDKGAALHRLRNRHRPDGIVYLGDDTTDEDAFAVLQPGDLGIKVGEGATRARFRVPDPPTAVAVLDLIRRHRSQVA